MTACSAGGCVVVDTAEDGTVYLSSDRRPEEKPVAIDADEWRTFLADVKAGKYGGDEGDLERLRAQRAAVLALLDHDVHLIDAPALARIVRTALRYQPT